MSGLFIYSVYSFVVCTLGKMAQDVGMMWKCCGVVPILFAWFLRVPSLHAPVFAQKPFCDFFLLLLTLSAHVCLCVHFFYSAFSHFLASNERYQRLQRRKCSKTKKPFCLKLLVQKLEALLTYCDYVSHSLHMQCFCIPLRNTYIMVICDRVTWGTRFSRWS